MSKTRDYFLSILEEKTNKYADRTAVGIRTQLGWKEFSYRGLGLLSRKLANYLINDVEVKKGDRCAILSESKPEYGACVFSAIMAGMTVVPLDIKLTKFELKSILTDCEPTVMLVSQAYVETALELQKEIPSIKTILVNDEPSYNLGLTSIYDVPNVYQGRWRYRSSKSTALIIYTSGTTGMPKGVEISFKNMYTQLKDLGYVLEDLFPGKKKEGMTCLSILPMNHLFEMTVGFSTFLNYGFSVYYTQSLKPKDILGIMVDKKVNFMIVVPAFLKLLKVAIEAELQKAPAQVKFIFKTMYHLARFIPSYRVKKMLFKKIHDKFGGHFTHCISGGAPMDSDVAKFFNRIGIRVMQGYGLSETSPVVSVNHQNLEDLHSVGKPLKSFETKVDPETGELLLKGPSVMKGYHNQEELTKEVIDEDGWLHTGDIARISKEGHIYITGRIKNMIVLSGGKKVFPEEVEAVLEKSEYVAEVCVLGTSRTSGSKDGTEEITAVIVPRETLYADKDEATIDKLIRDDVKVLSNRLALYKRPTNVIINKDPLPKTTTRKIKRKDVRELLAV